MAELRSHFSIYVHLKDEQDKVCISYVEMTWPAVWKLPVYEW